MKKTLIAALFLLLSAGITTNAVAVSFSLAGIKYPDLIAEVDFFYNTGAGTLNINITNSSSATLGNPVLTAFGFNVPQGATGVSDFTGPTGWNSAFALDGIETPNLFGDFDIAAITGSNGIGGDPQKGIGVGVSGSFMFTLIGNDNIFKWTEEAFLSSLSEPKNINDVPQYFFARFQSASIDEIGSDIAVPVNPVPEPTTMLLLGTGLVGLAGLGRKKLKQK
jgi:hypothetical protein